MMAADGTSIIVPTGSLRLKADSFVFEVFLHFGQDHLALSQLQQRADHGKHDAHVAEGTGS